MAYSDFTFEQVIPKFGLQQRITPLFSHLQILFITNWLLKSLRYVKRLALISGSDKAHSEFSDFIDGDHHCINQ